MRTPTTRSNRRTWRCMTRARSRSWLSDFWNNPMKVKSRAVKTSSTAIQTLRPTQRNGCRNAPFIRKPSTRVTIADGGGHRFEIEPGEEVDGFEMGIERRRTADASAHVEIGAKQFRNFRRV